MRFPDSDRVIYAKNPLESVICQIRFPAILRIDAETPVAFQERVRATYPLFKDRQSIDAGAALPPELFKVFGEDFPWIGKSTRKTYEFRSEDEIWTISLTNESIALTSKRYTRWEEFRERMLNAVVALEQIYQPAHCTRIGLRYRDLIIRSKLDLKDVNWSELLQPHICGELSSAIGNHVKQVKKEILVQLDGGNGNVRIVHGLVQQAGTDEPCYLIDSDYFTAEKMEVNRAGERLDYFNREAGRLFKWCVTPMLHQAMEPGDVPSRDQPPV